MLTAQETPEVEVLAVLTALLEDELELVEGVELLDEELEPELLEEELEPELLGVELADELEPEELEPPGMVS